MKLKSVGCWIIYRASESNHSLNCTRQVIIFVISESTGRQWHTWYPIPSVHWSVSHALIRLLCFLSDTAYCRNPCTQKWYKYDDDHVSEMSESDVRVCIITSDDLTQDFVKLYLNNKWIYFKVWKKSYYK